MSRTNVSSGGGRSVPTGSSRENASLAVSYALSEMHMAKAGIEDLSSLTCASQVCAMRETFESYCERMWAVAGDVEGKEGASDAELVRYVQELMRMLQDVHDSICTMKEVLQESGSVDVSPSSVRNKERQEVELIALEKHKSAVGEALQQVENHLATSLKPKASTSPTVQSSPQSGFVVFISHAGEDKQTVAVPIWKKLRRHGIKAFLDKHELRPGENANEAMEKAMRMAWIGIFILSTEFAAKKWPMNELGCFMDRLEEAKRNGTEVPLLIPVFWRMGLDDWRDPNLFRRPPFGKGGFLERVEGGETSMKDVRERLRVLSRHTGVLRDDCNDDATGERVVDEVVNIVIEACRRRGSESSSADGEMWRESGDAVQESELAALRVERPVAEYDLVAQFEQLLR